METAANKPLYEILRPAHIDDIVGQPHLIGENGIISAYVRSNKLFSMLFFGPPGTGKTTLARLLAEKFNANFIYFNAVEASTVDIKKAIKDECGEGINLLFVDEIHRFNKNQQTIFLPHMESGRITLVATTTENPGYNIIAPLRSRLRVLKFMKLDDRGVGEIIRRGFDHYGRDPGSEYADLIIDYADGDGRFALFLLEEMMSLLGERDISPAEMKEVLSKKMLLSDKKGDFFYNYLSALHKSIRGSDADAAAYWIALMLDSGMDPVSILRRMTAIASEDIGFADPNALRVVADCRAAFEFLGLPEGRLALFQAGIYLALAPKSNSIQKISASASELVKTHGILEVPANIMSNTRTYKYPHDYDDYLVRQRYLPGAIDREEIVSFNDHGKEIRFRDRWEMVRTAIKKGKK